MERLLLTVCMLSIVHAQKSTGRFVAHNESVSWLQAMDICFKDGAYLASAMLRNTVDNTLTPAVQYGLQANHLTVFDDAKAKIKEVIDDVKEAIGIDTPDTKKESLATQEIVTDVWTPKGVTGWVWLRGCVGFSPADQDKLMYSESKHNRMSQCASACHTFPSFLVQENSCYCTSRNITDVDYVAFSKCNLYCPGNADERCGGPDTFLLYQFHTGDLQLSGERLNRHCVTLAKSAYMTSPCRKMFGFTCRFPNDRYVTYSHDIPNHDHVRSLKGAVDFCAGFSDSLGLAAVPKLHMPYFGEKYWTGLIRTVIDDFTYTVPGYAPSLVYMVRGRDQQYEERLVNSSSTRKFICQYDTVTCGGYQNGTDGTLFSPQFPDNYGNNIHCEWTINVTSNHVIQFTIESIELEVNERCAYDYIKIRDLGTYTHIMCHTEDEGLIITTSSNIVKVVFKSDDTMTAKGFKISWQAVVPEVSDQGPVKELGGGVIAGISVGVTVGIVLSIIFIVGIILFWRRYAAHQKVSRELSATNNAMYGISFADDSDFSAMSTAGYENTSAKKDLHRNASYANDPSKVVECNTNVYEDLVEPSCSGNGCGDNTSKANLLIDSDDSSALGGSMDNTPNDHVANVKDKGKKAKDEKGKVKHGKDNKKHAKTWDDPGQETVTSGSGRLENGMFTMDEVQAMGNDTIVVQGEHMCSNNGGGFVSDGYESWAPTVNGDRPTTSNSRPDDGGYIEIDTTAVAGDSCHIGDRKMATKAPDHPLHAYLKLQDSTMSNNSHHYEEMQSIRRDNSARNAVDNEYIEYPNDSNSR